jgi:RNA-directed DNA polymerase
MKRVGNLWPEITSFGNLFLAAQQAAKGKKMRGNVLEFNADLDRNLWQLKAELEAQVYHPGNYVTFELKKPKYRLISAAPFRDRVVHHALCNIISPILERSFLPHSYANRTGFGSHKALQQAVKHCRHYKYVLKCDISKYFPNIDHQILKDIIGHKIKCTQTLKLIDLIIDNSNPQPTLAQHFPGDELLTPLQRRKGLPLGNLSSQFFANLYLNGLDHFVLEQIKIPAYIRYVDDFLVFSDSKDSLHATKANIEEYLVSLRLKNHPRKSQVIATSHGVSFLGFQILPDRLRVNSDNLRQGYKRLKNLQQQYENGILDSKQVQQSVQSWQAHLNHANTWRWQQQLFTKLTWFSW